MLLSNRARLLALLLTGLCGCAAATPPRPPVAPTSVVIGQSITLASKVLGETRRINIYTPSGYDTGDVRYPVLYMPDGGIHEDFHHITGIVQVSTANGTMRPLLVVGIENTERRRDLTGPTEIAEDRKIAPRVGGSAQFRRFLREELMPAVRKRYRTSDETAIVGESLAGLFVLETFFLEPDLFDTYIAVDPSVWWNAGSLGRNAVARLERFGAQRKTLYLSTSDEKELQEGTLRIAEALRQVAPAGLRWQYEPMPDEHHSTIFHGAALRAFRAVLAPAGADAGAAATPPSAQPPGAATPHDGRSTSEVWW